MWSLLMLIPIIPWHPTIVSYCTMILSGCSYTMILLEVLPWRSTTISYCSMVLAVQNHGSSSLYSNCPLLYLPLLSLTLLLCCTRFLYLVGCCCFWHSYFSWETPNYDWVAPVSFTFWYFVAISSRNHMLTYWLLARAVRMCVILHGPFVTL